MKEVKQAQRSSPIPVWPLSTRCPQTSRAMFSLPHFLFYKMDFFLPHFLRIKGIHKEICNPVLSSVEPSHYEIFVTAHGQ